MLTAVVVTWRAPGGNYAGGGGGGGTTLLYLWVIYTGGRRIADLESELVKYGPVKEVSGYCGVKEGMKPVIYLNGRPCVVAFLHSPYGVRRPWGGAGFRGISRGWLRTRTENKPSAMVNKGRGGRCWWRAPNWVGILVGEEEERCGGGNWGRGGVLGVEDLMGNMRNRMGPCWR
ncbi:uncharacterized protein A4U43_C01F5600 [Asparagus officinalis]|uniref:Uncharacterized protein n=1 Tax=Asparagus officinalis TaxID=4686 RepID=A0A5P1FNR7_ASPOF|nr:uncharacterized protein A4U43_C01F5600 [Asparagus officinalis]